MSKSIFLFVFCVFNKIWYLYFIILHTTFRKDNMDVFTLRAIVYTLTGRASSVSNHMVQHSMDFHSYCPDNTILTLWPYDLHDPNHGNKNDPRFMQQVSLLFLVACWWQVVARWLVMGGQLSSICGGCSQCMRWVGDIPVVRQGSWILGGIIYDNKGHACYSSWSETNHRRESFMFFLTWMAVYIESHYYWKLISEYHNFEIEISIMFC